MSIQVVYSFPSPNLVGPQSDWRRCPRGSNTPEQIPLPQETTETQLETQEQRSSGLSSSGWGILHTRLASFPGPRHVPGNEAASITRCSEKWRGWMNQSSFAQRMTTNLESQPTVGLRQRKLWLQSGG